MSCIFFKKMLSLCKRKHDFKSWTKGCCTFDGDLCKIYSFTIFNIYLLFLIMFSSKVFYYVKCKILLYYVLQCYKCEQALIYKTMIINNILLISIQKKKRKKREDMKRSTEPFLLKINNNRVWCLSWRKDVKELVNDVCKLSNTNIVVWFDEQQRLLMPTWMIFLMKCKRMYYVQDASIVLTIFPRILDSGFVLKKKYSNGEFTIDHSYANVSSNLNST